MRISLFLPIICPALCVTAYAGESSKSRYEAVAHSRLAELATNQPNVRFLHSLTNLPASIREKLASIADAGQPFSKGCVGSDPHQRFLVATKAGNTYNVAIERGGYVYTWVILQFVLDPAGKVVQQTQVHPRAPASQSQPAGSETNRVPSAPGPGG